MTREQEIEMQTAVTSAVFGVYIAHRHNPQLLLTDQRTPEKKRADEMVSAFRDAYPSVIDWAALHRPLLPLSETFYSGGTLGEVYEPKTATGRWKSDRVPYMKPFPADEVVLVKPIARKRSFVHDIDFGTTAARVLASMALPKVVMQIDTSSFREGLEAISDSARRMEKVMRLHRQAMSRQFDRRVIAMFGEIDLTVPEPTFVRERRIAKLLTSRDRRQRKRGERLFDAWSKERNR